MEEQNINSIKKNQKIIILIIILACLVLGSIVFIAYHISSQNQRESKPSIEDKTEKKTDLVDDSDIEEETTEDPNGNQVASKTKSVDEFDFDTLSNDLHTAIQKEDIVPFLSICQSETSANGPHTTYENTVVSNASIDTIINKLKEAQSVDFEITYSWFGCPPKQVTYYISVNSTDPSVMHQQRVFSLNYGGGEALLLVGYQNKGYAFRYQSDEETQDFIESLKKLN